MVSRSDLVPSLGVAQAALRARFEIVKRQRLPALNHQVSRTIKVRPTADTTKSTTVADDDRMARSTPISRNVGRLSRSQVAAKRGLHKG